MYPFSYGGFTYGWSPDTIIIEGASYNLMLYNENLYDAGILVLGLFDSVSGADVEFPYAQLVKTELFTLADTLYKLLNNDPWLDDVVPMSAIVAFLVSKPLSGELITLSEICTRFSDKPLADSVSLLETLVNEFNTAYFDFILLTDSLTKQMTNKGLFDEMQLNDWLAVEPKYLDDWHD